MTRVLQVVCVIFLSFGLIAARGVERSDAEDIDSILGGTTVPKGQQKFMVHLRMTKGGSTFVCGGTLISNQHVLTAAHCVNDKPYDQVMAYMKVYTVIPMEPTNINRTVPNEGIFIHANYSSTDLINDIAILKLNSTVDLRQVAKVNLPANRTKATYVGTNGIAIGWGLKANNGTSISSTMQQVTLKVQEAPLCDAMFRSMYQDVYHLCTFQAFKSICLGDSGGPIMAGTTQIGISSFVQAEAGLPRCERGAVFTRVSTYVTNGWIAANML